jgi:hypothetical protein
VRDHWFPGDRRRAAVRVLLTAAGIIAGAAAGLSMALRAGRALNLGLTAPDALSFAGSHASTAVRVVAGAL